MNRVDHLFLRFHGREVDGSLTLHEVHERSRRGDIVGVTGHPTRSKSGELSLMVRDYLTNEMHCSLLTPNRSPICKC